MKSRSKVQVGVLALVLLAALYGLTGILARYFSEDLGLFEQWYVRYMVALPIGIIVFNKSIRWRRYVQLPRRDYVVFVVRVFVGSVIATALYSWAAQRIKIGTLAFTQAVPFTVVFGIWLFRERLTKLKGLFILLSLLGVCVLIIKDPRDVTHFGLGELAGVLSNLAFSFAIVTRKWHSSKLNNREIVLGSLGLAIVFNYIVSAVFEHRLAPPLDIFTPTFILVLIVAGMLSVLISLLSNYGYEHVNVILAGNIITLEQVFGPLLGFLVYRERLGWREFMGGGIVVAAVVGMNYAENLHTRKQRMVQASPAS